MKALEMILSAASRERKSIVLSEGDDPRVLEAAAQAASDNLASVQVIGTGTDKPNLTFINPRESSWSDAFAQALWQLRQHKGMTLDQAREQVTNPLVFANLMVRLGHADGCLSGARYTTADVVRSAIQIVGKRADIHSISSFFIMLREEPFYGDTHYMIFSDCGLIVDPDKQQLAEIAITSALSAQKILNILPKIAMLSFSTHGSAQHALVDKVRQAKMLVESLAPTLIVDGEMQLDAAIVPAVAAQKSPGSRVAGQANVLIFPDLASGNIGYKLCQRIGNAIALGPVLQGLKRPANDLSRGCSVADIYNMIAITAIQAQENVD